jgi:hypothetical protein
VDSEDSSRDTGRREQEQRRNDGTTSSGALFRLCDQ